MKFQSELTPAAQKVTLSGAVDETTALVCASISKMLQGPNVLFDWNRTTFINSLGIAHWIQFIQTFPESWKINYASCPRFIIDTINMVPPFIGQGKVSSFYIPFWCPHCRHYDDVLFHTRERLLLKANAVHTCPSCGKAQKVDCHLDEYLAFL